MDITLQRLSYRELENETQLPGDDSFGMISDYLTSAVRNTLLANPNLIDKSQTALNIAVCEGTIGGRNMLMPTKLKINDKIVAVQTGGSYEIAEQFRGRGIGTAIFKDSIFNSDYDIYFGQLYSTTAIAIIRKLGLIVLELPSFYKLCKSRSILEAKGLRGLPLKVGSLVADVMLKLMDFPNAWRLQKLKTCYEVKEEHIIPAWVNDLTLNDGHAFTEVHDTNWLQWCLDNRFTEDPKDRQSFYAVYDKQGSPKGFFMTKERVEKNQGRYKNLMRGTVVEWGSFDESELSEAALNLLAIDSFGNRVDNITTVLSGASLEKEIKKLGFIKHGSYQVTITHGVLDQEGISEQSKWRIRYGGCNTIIL